MRIHECATDRARGAVGVSLSTRVCAGGHERRDGSSTSSPAGFDDACRARNASACACRGALHSRGCIASGAAAGRTAACCSYTHARGGPRQLWAAVAVGALPCWRILASVRAWAARRAAAAAPGGDRMCVRATSRAMVAARAPLHTRPLASVLTLWCVAHYRHTSRQQDRRGLD